MTNYKTSGYCCKWASTSTIPAAETALHITIKVPSRFLLENRANVCEEDGHYNTPLYIASCLANEPAMRLLLDYEADPMGGRRSSRIMCRRHHCTGQLSVVGRR